ncbi:neural cell adhesion molecule 1-like [Penaeus japonicus]|uniref:neural cell adhesion molecule 1-like n=1 Tax=Penaeus japonicus TaxID=27405 RepID=UPI001C714023|nr:neural cell adhesion molecule 1-like [Penaeus japonicus]
MLLNEHTVKKAVKASPAHEDRFPSALPGGDAKDTNTQTQATEGFKHFSHCYRQTLSQTARENFPEPENLVKNSDVLLERLVPHVYLPFVGSEEPSDASCASRFLLQMANLKVVVPPEIVDNETSRDTEVKEGDSVKLSCKARGFPQPVVSWQREGGKGIVFRDLGKTVNSSEGGELELTAVERSDMGPYLCIAKNGIPPSVSKRILLRVNFSPKLHVPIDMMGSPLGKNVSIKCTIEASPRSVNTWRKDPGEQMIISSPKYNVSEYHEAFYVTHLSLTIRNFSKEDVNTYRCVASNSLGSTDSSVHVYEIPQEPRVNKNKDDSRLENHIPNSEYESNTKNEFAFSTDLEDTKVDATYRDPYPPGSGLQPPGKEKEVPSKEANSRQQPSGGITFPIFNSSQSSLASWGSFGLLLLCHVLAGFRALLF